MKLLINTAKNSHKNSDSIKFDVLNQVTLEKYFNQL